MTDTPILLRRPDALVVAGIALASFGALATAYVAQYGFDLWPCELCLVQRAPYVAAMVLGALALMPAVDKPSRRQVVDLAILLFLIGAGTALYHVGVEEKWWKGPAGCAGAIADYSPEDLMKALNQPGRTGCEEAAFRFLGISMAGYNAIAALILAGLCLAARRRADIWR